MQKQNNTIAIFIVYFGKPPWYFEYFLHSCKFNSDVHFYFISDTDFTIIKFPENVFPVQLSIAEIKDIAFQKFGFRIALENSYKFCDFRPALAYLFPQYVKGYAYWGYGDIDVIYGNIRNFITDDMLSNYDVISVRHDYLPGAFSLFKNCKKINELFKESKDYIKVFTNPKHYCFDETNFSFNEFTKGIPVENIESEVESMTHVIKKLYHQNSVNAYFDFHLIEGLPGKLKWDNGVLMYKNSMEVILYHLIKLKTIYTPKKVPSQIPGTFFISPTKIYF